MSLRWAVATAPVSTSESRHPCGKIRFMMKLLALGVIGVVAIVGCVGTERQDAPFEVETDTPETKVPQAPASKEAEGPVVIACPPGETIQVRVSPALPSVVIEATQKAFSKWESLLQGKTRFNVFVSDEAKAKYRSCNIYVIWDEDADENFGSAAVKRNENSLTTASGVLWVNKKEFKESEPETTFATVLHESGHLVGLEHDRSREHETLMWPFITVPGQVGCEDVRRACGIWGCTAKCEGNGWLE